ncbi:MAG: UDP-3-O-[3-hydroxymyristoyl] N-acetylglucosamine deacetylase [Hahellaceae bacterium]|nr:UDP-3-O-[3-hydroxymyristoyl] N-acetylglucosamine deacetylase [Hahellaceae bacterium]MCP5210419.1 UDP-3-O-[3-hydroxymyristoyl] N-acetylglucosamine deacetylase [Hahellaceae bacterium]
MNNMENSRKSRFQQTLAKPFSCIGCSIHRGARVSMTVMPGEADTGYVFYRKDIANGQGEVAARWNTVSQTKLSTSVSNRFGVEVNTIEHLVAALYGCGIDNARIVLNGPEVPIMDGSAKAFVESINMAGKKTLQRVRTAFVITKPIAVAANGAVAMLVPSPVSEFEISINFPKTAIGEQAFTTTLEHAFTKNDVTNARTFGFAQEISVLKRIGLAKGGTLENALLVDGEKIINEGGLRYQDEFVRHKVLDSIGDLALAGATIVGKFIGNKSGHHLNNLLLREMMMQENNWIFTSTQQAEENWSELVDYSLAV